MSKSKHEEYDAIRRAFYLYFQLQVLQSTGLIIEAGPIEYSLLDQTLDWKGRRYPWNWFDLKRKFRSIPARFELAISVDGELCGLIIGKPSRGRRHLSAYYLEGNPSRIRPLKSILLEMLLEGMRLYGDALNCSYLRLIRPVEGLLETYRAAGFQVATGKNIGLYCERALKRGEI